MSAGFQEGEGGGGGGGGGGYGGGFSLDLSEVFTSNEQAPWEGLGNVVKILKRLGCSREVVERAWRGGDVSRRAVRDLAKDSVYYFALKRPKNTIGQREASVKQTRADGEKWFRRNPTRLSTFERILSGALGCPFSAAGGSAPIPTGPSVPRERTGRIELERDRMRRARAFPIPQDPAPTRPPTLPNGNLEPEPAWLRLLRIVAEQVQTYREQQEQRAVEREQRRALRMSLSDSFGTVLASAIQTAPAAMQVYADARANRQASRNALRQSRLGFGMGGQLQSFSGVPLPGTLPATLGGMAGMLLGQEPGVLEEGGILERLGLEGDVERTATLWKRTASGFRAVRSLTAANPSTGSLSTWLNMGRPVLYTGDLAACKRVNKIAARVGRVARRRGIVKHRARARR